MPLLDSRACDRLYHLGARVPQAERIVLPGNLCAGYLGGHKDACQVRTHLYSLCSAPHFAGPRRYPQFAQRLSTHLALPARPGAERAAPNSWAGCG